MLAAEAMDVDEVTQTVFGERKTVRLKPTSTYRGGGVRGGLAQTEVLKGEEQHPRDQRRVAGGRKAQCPRSRMSGTAWPEFSDVTGTISEEAGEADEEREEERDGKEGRCSLTVDREWRGSQGVCMCERQTDRRMI